MWKGWGRNSRTFRGLFGKCPRTGYVECGGGLERLLVVVQAKRVMFEIVSQRLRHHDFFLRGVVGAVRPDHHSLEPAGDAVEVAQSRDIAQLHALEVFHRHEKDR